MASEQTVAELTKDAENTFSVPLSSLVKQFRMEKVFVSSDYEQIEIHRSDVNRPGLPLSGFFDYFDPNRLQILGKVEMTYLEDLSKERRSEVLGKLFAQDFPALIVTRDLPIFSEMIEQAKDKNITILRTERVTSQLMSEVISYLSYE